MLVPGKLYKDNDHCTVSIGGPCRDHPEWVWSICGNWFDKETGAFVMWTRNKGHFLMPMDSRRSITDHTPLPD